MRKRSQSNQNMHKLVTGAINVKSSWVPSLRNTGCVDGSTGSVQQTETDEVIDRTALILYFPAVEKDAMDDGDES